MADQAVGSAISRAYDDGYDVHRSPTKAAQIAGSPKTPTSYAQYSSPSPRKSSAKSSPGPSYLGMYFSPTPQKTVSVLHRPPHPALSMKNAENLDVQYEKDKAAAERHANAFRRHAGEKWHHNGPGAPTLLEQGHIVDRGRGKGAQPARGVFDPILSEYRIPPAEDLQVTRPSARPSSAPRYSIRPDKSMQVTMGVRNPITGECKPGYEPDPSYEARKQLEFDRLHGGVSSGISSRGLVTGPFNPINHQPYDSAPAPRQRPQSAPRCGGQAAGYVNSQYDRPHTPGKRQILNGQSWGQYNPILHTYQVPPEDSRFADASAQLEKTRGLTGSHVAKVAIPRSQGVYDVILNRWVVPPADVRVMEGLSFAPATMFTRHTASTIRSPH